MTKNYNIESNFNYAGSKAENLITLNQSDTNLNIPEFIVINHNNENNDTDMNILTFLQGLAENDKVAVRSSGSLEDSLGKSFAGMYQTVLNINPDLDSIKSAMQAIQAHAKNKISSLEEYSNSDKQNLLAVNIIIQKMIQPDFAGVIFTEGENPHYATVNVCTGLGEAIVSGSTSGRVINALKNVRLDSCMFNKLLEASKKVCEVLQNDRLDIEFAITDSQNNDPTVHILQARPITTESQQSLSPKDSQIHHRYIRFLETRLKSSQGILSNMSGNQAQI